LPAFTLGEQIKGRHFEFSEQVDYGAEQSHHEREDGRVVVFGQASATALGFEEVDTEDEG